MPKSGLSKNKPKESGKRRERESETVRLHATWSFNILTSVSDVILARGPPLQAAKKKKKKKKRRKRKEGRWSLFPGIWVWRERRRKMGWAGGWRQEGE